MADQPGLGADTSRLRAQFFDDFTKELELAAKRVDTGAATYRVLDGPAYADVDESVEHLTPPSVVSNLVTALANVPQRHQLDVNRLGELLQSVEEGNAAVAGDAVHVNT